MGADRAAGPMPALEAHDWPGSVREREHVIERAVILSRGAELTFNKTLGVPIQEGDPEPETMAKAARTPILRVLEAARWRVAGPALPSASGSGRRTGIAEEETRYPAPR
jgi:DNA-binding NtrC family response regulator